MDKVLHYLSACIGAVVVVCLFKSIVFRRDEFTICYLEEVVHKHTHVIK